MRCGLCAGVWLDPDFTPAALTRFYEQDYRRLFPAEAVRPGDTAFITALRLPEIAERRLTPLLSGLRHGARVLEVGSGFGATLARLAALRPDLVLHAIEPDATHRTLALDGAAVRFVADVAAAAPYDLILAFHVLEHLPDPAAALADWRDALAPGGRIALEVPDIAAQWTGWQEVHPAHLSYFTGPSLDRLLARTGGMAILASSPPFAGVLTRALAVGAMPAPAPASSAEIIGLDAHVTARPWGWRQVLRAALGRAAAGLVGAATLGEWARWRQGPALAALLGPRAAGARIECLGAPLDPLDRGTVLARAEAALAGAGRLALGDLNVAKLIMARDDPALGAALRRADLVLADGMGIVFGLRALGVRLPARIAGIDLAEDLIALCARRGWRPYLLGARAEVVAAAAARWQARHPTLVFAGWRDGYFPPDADAAVAAAVAASGADLLIVAMGVPRQEVFLAAHGPACGARVTLAVGGALDVVAGRLRRAPPWMQRAGLEWLWRLAQEPLRLGRRYLVTNSRFALLLLGARLTGWRP